VTHPIELLAPFVDDTLTAAERTTVEVHLSGCRACRDEVMMARTARRTLGSMPSPSTIPDDIGAPALAEMLRVGARGPRWTRILPIAVAAAVVGLLVVSIPRIGSGGRDDTRASVEAGTSDAPADLRLLATDIDLDPGSLQDAAKAFVTQRATSSEDQAAEAAPGAPTAASVAAPARSLGAGRTDTALRCLRSAFTGFPGQVVRLERVTFEGSQAYLAYVLEGPGAGQPADTVSLWVASAADCSILSLTSASL
jgi:hypothetical protein